MCCDELAAFLAYFGPVTGVVSATLSRIKDEGSEQTFNDLRYLFVMINSVGLLILASCNHPLL